ncbi:hypothetical protein BX600DRAFT_447379 [Xylariales sp. PMI_506]|nr:hypothetical protein BX600DRAFT_447379 [Xylariales sp. PMI_506]
MNGPAAPKTRFHMFVPRAPGSSRDWSRISGITVSTDAFQSQFKRAVAQQDYLRPFVHQRAISPF